MSRRRRRQKPRKPSGKKLAAMIAEAKRMRLRSGARTAPVSGRAVPLVNRVSNRQCFTGATEDEITYIVDPSKSRSSESTAHRQSEDHFVSLKNPYADEPPSWLLRKRRRKMLRKLAASQSDINHQPEQQRVSSKGLVGCARCGKEQDAGSRTRLDELPWFCDDCKS